MEKVVKIEKNIEVEPVHLHQGIKDSIKSILENTKICNSEGYIDTILDIIQIENIGISKHTNFPVFKVVFSAIKIMPEIDKPYVCKISQIYGYAIVLEYKGPIKIILPESNLLDYKIKDSKFLERNGKLIKQGDNLEVVFVNIKYSKGNFNCIAKILS